MHRRFAALMATTLTILQPVTGDVQAATEKSWFGQFDLAEKTAARSVRFFARKDGLSLFATGDFRAILLQGFYTKAKMSVGYRTIECPGGITGYCGKVNFVSVEVGNNF